MLRSILAFTGLCITTLTSAACVSAVDPDDRTKETIETRDEKLSSSTFDKPIYRCILNGMHTFWGQYCTHPRTNEGTAFYLQDCASADTTPLYIAWVPYGQQTVLTINAQEVQGLLAAGWTGGGVLGYVSTAPSQGLVPLFRLYNPTSGDRLFTINATERAALLGAGWIEEATGAYVSATMGSDSSCFGSPTPIDPDWL